MLSVQSESTVHIIFQKEMGKNVKDLVTSYFEID
jgi:hypothetical protein